MTIQQLQSELSEAYRRIEELEEIEQESYGKDDYIQTLEARLKEARISLDNI